MKLINHLNPIKESFFLFVIVATMAFMPHFTPPQYPTESSDSMTATPSEMGVNNSFQNGEELVYKVYYNLNFVWIGAGEVTFRVDDEGARYHLSAEGKTYSSYEWFYKAYNKLDSYVDKNTLLPQRQM